MVRVGSARAGETLYVMKECSVRSGLLWLSARGLSAQKKKKEEKEEEEKERSKKKSMAILFTGSNVQVVPACPCKDQSSSHY